MMFVSCCLMWALHHYSDGHLLMLCTCKHLATHAGIPVSSSCPQVVSVWCMNTQYHILREKGTEPPGSGKYNKFYEQVGLTQHITSFCLLLLTGIC